MKLKRMKLTGIATVRPGFPFLVPCSHAPVSSYFNDLEIRRALASTAFHSQNTPIEEPLTD